MVTIAVKDDYPRFGQVAKIFVTDNNTIYLHIRQMNTLNFNVHLHVYVVQLTPYYYTTVTVSSQYSVFPLHLQRVTIRRSIQLCIIPNIIYCTHRKNELCVNIHLVLLSFRSNRAGRQSIRLLFNCDSHLIVTAI